MDLCADQRGNLLGAPSHLHQTIHSEILNSWSRKHEKLDLESLMERWWSANCDDSDTPPRSPIFDPTDGVAPTPVAGHDPVRWGEPRDLWPEGLATQNVPHRELDP